MQEPTETSQREIGIIHRGSWGLALDQLVSSIEIDLGINKTVADRCFWSDDDAPLRKAIGEQ